MRQMAGPTPLDSKREMGVVGLGCLFPNGLVLLVAWLLAAPQVEAEPTPLLGVTASSDITIELSGKVIEDQDLAEDDFSGNVSVATYTGIPLQADVTGHHLLANGDLLLAVDTAVLLPASSGSLAIRSGDVVRFDGTHYALEFDADLAGIDPGAAVDAISRDGDDLLMSFDVTVHLNPGDVVVDDEDLVRWDGITFSPFWDGSEQGVDPALDLDAAHWIESVETLLVSFNSSGLAGGTAFDDEDLLENDPALQSWHMAYDASLIHSQWNAGMDMDAFTGSPDPDEDGMSDLVESRRGTNPLSDDTDNDGLKDPVETGTGLFVSEVDTGTNPLLKDSDRDGWTDGVEVALGSDPNDDLSTPEVIPGDSYQRSNALKIILLKKAVESAK